MSEPRRLLEEGATDFERTLLESALSDAPPSEAVDATLTVLGLGAATAGSVAMSASGGVAASTKAGAGLIAGKWVVMSTVGALLTVGIVHEAAKHSVAGHSKVTHPVGAAPAQDRPSAPAPVPEPSAALNAEVSLPATAEVAKPVVVTFPAPKRPETAQHRRGHPLATQPTSVAGPPVPPHFPASTAGLEAQAEPRTPSATTPASPWEPAPPAKAPSHPDTVDASPNDPLVRELFLLDRARVAADAGDLSRALSLLDECERRGGQLGPEAKWIRIQILVRSGDRASAVTAARDYLVREPFGPYAKRIRDLLGADASKL
jgi:hypothetical protein